MKRRHIHESMTWPLQSCKIHRYEYAAEDVAEVGSTPAWCLHTLFPGSVNRSSPAAIECTSFFSVWAQCKQLVRKLHLCCTCTWCRRHFSSQSSQWKIIELDFSWTCLPDLLLALHKFVQSNFRPWNRAHAVIWRNYSIYLFICIALMLLYFKLKKCSIWR